MVKNENGIAVKSFDTEITRMLLNGDENPYYIERWDVRSHDSIIEVFGIAITKDSIYEEILIQQELHMPPNVIKVKYDVNLK